MEKLDENLDAKNIADEASKLLAELENRYPGGGAQFMVILQVMLVRKK